MKYLLILFFALSFGLEAKTLMVSHKGIWKDHIYAQNTFEALEQALKNGFKGIEFDVLLTKDQRLVLAHEASLKRVSNCKGKIQEKNLSELLKCKVTHNTKLPLTQILVKKVKKPTHFTSLKNIIDELLARPNLEFVWIDLKDKRPGLALALQTAFEDIDDRSLLKKIMVNSTDSKILMEVKDLFPEIRTSLEGKWGSEPLTDFEKYFGGIGHTHDAISLNLGFPLGHRGSLNPFFRKKRFWKLVNKFVSEAKKRSATTVGWTVNKKKKISKLVSLEIEYLLTDLVNP